MGQSTRKDLQAFAAVFTVDDVAASIAYYRDKLGFRIDFTLGDPPGYAIIERDCVSLHLMPATRAPATRGQSSIYVFAADLDRLYGELLSTSTPIEAAPQDYDYGMREFSVRDPDGNRITFGCEVRPPNS